MEIFLVNWQISSESKLHLGKDTEYNVIYMDQSSSVLIYVIYMISWLPVSIQPSQTHFCLNLLPSLV